MMNPADGSFCRSCATPIALVQPIYDEPQTQRMPDPPAWTSGFGYQEPQQNQWQQSNWQQPFGGPLQAQPMAFQPGPSNRSVIALCLVAAGFLCCGPILSIPGAIVGYIEVQAIKDGRAPQAGLSMAQIAMWGGIAVTILTTIGLIFGFLFGIIDAIANG